MEHYECDCCGKEFEETAMCLIEGELICVECVEDFVESEHSSESRLSVWERSK